MILLQIKPALLKITMGNTFIRILSLRFVVSFILGFVGSILPAHAQNPEIQIAKGSCRNASAEDFISTKVISFPNQKSGLICLRFYFEGSQVSALKVPAVYAGRIGDADIAFLNGIEIGETGMDIQTGRFVPHISRVYTLPLGLIRSENFLDFEVRKIAAGLVIPLGLTEGPPVFGEYRDLTRRAFYRSIVRTWMPLCLGFAGVLFGIYHLFLFFYLRSKKNYRVFGLLLLNFGFFSMSFSFWFYEFLPDPRIGMFIHCVASFMGLYYFIRYLVRDQSKLSRWFHLFSRVVVIGYSLAALVSISSFDRMLSVFLFWHPILILSVITSLISSIYYWRKHDRTQWFPVFASGLFISALIYDVLVTQQLIIVRSDQLAAPAFMLVLAAGVLLLGRDFAHAYLNVERTVEVRTEDLRAANEQLRSLDKMKERFFANISHDLKTPITVALGSVEDAFSSAGDVLKPAKRSLQKLLTMIQELLDTVKSESGEMKLDWKSTKISSAIRDWAEPFQSLCHRKGLELILDLEGYENLSIPMDPMKFERVFQNLMSNALKFTAKGQIKVSIHTDQSRAYLEFSDSGIGIPESERGQVFSRFFQSSRTNLKEHGGSGIGLSFVKEMVKLHNGEITVEESEWGGTKFVVALPLSQAVEVTGEFDLREISPSDVRGSLDVAFPPASPDEINEDKARILCVEDNPEVAQIVTSALRDDYNVFFASNGKIALNRLTSSEKFDLVVSDISMPEMSGDELVSAMRENAKIADIPVIMLTSHSEDERIVDLLLRGATDYVTKPFNRDILRARVQAHLKGFEIARHKVALSKLTELGHLSAGIAHEGRNSFMPVMSSINSLKSDIDSLLESFEIKEYSNEQARYVKRIKYAAEKYKNAFDRVMPMLETMSYFSSGSKHRTELNIDDLIAMVQDSNKYNFRTQGIQVHVVGDRGVRVLGYKELYDALINLTSNAIYAVKVQYGEGKGGNITFGVYDRGEKVAIEVKDDGIGIPPDHIKKIFILFYTTKPTGEGTGLGMSIVREYIEILHAGRIEVESEGIGKGATIRLIIPKEAPERPDDDESTEVHGVKVD